MKSDLETIQKAMGMGPSLGREWIQWLKRDKWFSLWWCAPGLILIASALVPLDHAHKYAGFGVDQWAGILVAVTMLIIAWVYGRRVTGKDGRSEGAIREARRINGMDRQGFVFGLASLVQVVVYGFWGWQHHVPFETFWTGMFIVMGSTYLAVALAARAWTLLGWALPFLAYGLCLPLTVGVGKVLLFGAMFIAAALSFSLIQVLEIRKFESEH
ncbi:MAG TPA: hypothetical protein VGF90_06615, partial [Verrucomicrobiae bacterium]